MTIREIIIDELEKALELGVRFPPSFEVRIPVEALELHRKESGLKNVLHIDDHQVTVRDDVGREPRL